MHFATQDGGEQLSLNVVLSLRICLDVSRTEQNLMLHPSVVCVCLPTRLVSTLCVRRSAAFTSLLALHCLQARSPRKPRSGPGLTWHLLLQAPVLRVPRRRVRSARRNFDLAILPASEAITGPHRARTGPVSVGAQCEGDLKTWQPRLAWEGP